MSHDPTQSPQLQEPAEALVPPVGWVGMMRGLVRTARPHQWIKNLFVLAPLFFSKQFLIPEQLFLGLLAFALFCMTASTVYLFNDVADVEKDKQHPTKRLRPIPSGQLPIRVALIAALICGPGALIIGAFISPRLALVLGAYLLMNLAYSTVLKHVAFVDVTIIATGFVFRLLAGAFAIDVLISEWLFICTFLLALYLGMGKRLHELLLIQRGQASSTRKVLERYRLSHLEFGVLFVSGLTIAAYTIYTLTAALPEQPLRAVHTPFSSPWLPITIPMAVFGVTRFYKLLRHEDSESPTELMLRDWPFIVNLLIWGLTMLVLGFNLLGPSPV